MKTQNKLYVAMGTSSSLVLSDCLGTGEIPDLAAQGAEGLTSV